MPSQSTHSTQSTAVRRGQPFVLLVTTVLALLLASAPISVPAFADYQHNQQVNSVDYKNSHGYWDVVNLPSEFRLNTVHAALLPTGKVLLVAGSGNNQKNFDSYNKDGQITVLKTVVFNPADNSVKTVSTPSDLFCGGHATLQSGNILVAGGTSGYEILKNKVTKPAGAMVVHNEDPDSLVHTLKKGTKFVGPSGIEYLSTQDVVIQPAMKMADGPGSENGNGQVMHSSATVFVEAADADSSAATKTNDHYIIDGLNGDDVHNIYGQGGPMTLDKQDFRGDNQSYEFDPFKEVYVKTGNLNVSRWYPTLTTLTDGNVIASSGLDNTGQITQSTEQYSPISKSWTLGHNLALPTYPALFRTQNPDVLFYSGSSAGYGPAKSGRSPGFWNYKTNSFQQVSGLRQTNITETSGSVALPPSIGSNDGSQDNRIMVAGGGGVGESALVTSRTDIIDISATQPHYTPGPDLPVALRYLSLTVMPWDEIIANGGSVDYRGKEDNYSYKSFSINPTTNQLTPLADEIVARGYHSGSLLLPDGRILAFGNDPLYADKDNTTPGTFEQRLEIYSAPQLFHGTRPVLNGDTDSQQVHRGQQLSYGSNSAANIKTARLIPPSTTTHVTNVEQRSVGAVVKSPVAGKITIDIPVDQNLLPNGWYMLFVTNELGTPSQAKMIQVVD